MKQPTEIFHVGEATNHETMSIVALWEKTGLTRPWNDPTQDIQRALSAKSSTIFIAKNDHKIIGTAMAGYEGHRGWIYYLAVDPDYQKQGLGKKLYNTAEQWLKNQGAPKIQILIRADNQKVISFYEGLGFEKSSSLLMGKKITS